MQTALPIPRPRLLLVGFLVALATVGSAAETRLDPVGAARVDLTALALAVTAFGRDVGRFPSTAEGLQVLLERPVGPDAGRWRGPYLDPPRVPVDPWGNAYSYVARPEDAQRPFNLSSRGQDGVSADGGDGLDDVDLWAAPTEAPAEASAPVLPGALLPRLLRGPLALIVGLTVVVALLKGYARRVARQTQPHADGYVRRHRRGRSRPAGPRVQPQDQNKLRV